MSPRLQVLHFLSRLTHLPELGDLAFLSLFLNLITAVADLIAVCATHLLGHV